MIDQERLVKHLLELVQVDSLSQKEAQLALLLKQQLEELGADVEIDDAGKKVGSNTGNVIARISGNVPKARPILLSAHMDTVSPGQGVKPIRRGNIIRSDGSTILGSDDKSGIAIICEAVRAIKQNNFRYGDLEVVFTICEEIGMLGAKHLDSSRLRSRLGVVLDAEHLSRLDTKAPAADWIEFRVHGRAAHAGMYPEKGISAIKLAGEAIARMKLGRIDRETTANIGLISGGVATNVVPNLVVLQGEARSHGESKLKAQTAHMRSCLAKTASKYHIRLKSKTYRPRVKHTIRRDFPSMNVPKNSPIVQLILSSARTLGIRMELAASGGGFDANIFNAKGILTVGLGTGMREIHTVKEYVKIDEMTKATRLLLEVLKSNAALSREAT